MINDHDSNPNTHSYNTQHNIITIATAPFKSPKRKRL